jgi:hypothetical protein
MNLTLNYIVYLKAPSDIIHKCITTILKGKGTKLPGTWPPGRMNIVCRPLIFVGSVYEIRFMSIFWRPEFLDGFKVFRKIYELL